MRTFESTPDGYEKAVNWLKQNKLDHLIEKEPSTDGYTVVELANSRYDKAAGIQPKMKMIKFGDLAVNDQFRYQCHTWVKLDDHSARNPGRGHGRHFNKADLVGDYQSWFNS